MQSHLFIAFHPIPAAEGDLASTQTAIEPKTTAIGWDGMGFELKLQAAAMLLERAEVGTLRGLQVSPTHHTT